MSERDTNDDALERRTKRAFDRSTGEIDAATRARLAQARYRALEELGARRPHLFARRTLLPIGAAATIAFAAWLVFLRPQMPVVDADLKTAQIADLEILLGDADIEMLGEDVEFYAWLEDQPELPPPATGDGVG